MWFTFALIAGIFFGINSLMVRHYFRKHHDEWIFSFYFSFILTMIILPFFLYSHKIPNTIAFWGGILLVGIVIVIGNVMGFAASKMIGATTQSVVSKLRLLWIVIVGVVLFSEVLTTKKILGMILITTATLLVIDYKNWKVSKKGIILILLATITATIYAVLLKKLLPVSDTITILFFAGLIPAILNASIIPDFFNRAKKEFANIRWIISICFMAAVANLAMVQALSYDVLSGVYFVMDASLIIIIFGEHFMLKEKERLIWKAAALCLAIIGAILIHGV
jgi:drug/metabolite transporter (DMT)-like permease